MLSSQLGRRHFGRSLYITRRTGHLTLGCNTSTRGTCLTKLLRSVAGGTRNSRRLRVFSRFNVVLGSIRGGAGGL